MIRKHAMPILVIVAICSTAIGVSATNQWDSWQFADGSIKYYFPQNPYQGFYLDEAIGDSDSWDGATDISLTSTGRPQLCGDVFVGVADFFGDTGYAGLTVLDCTDGWTIKSGWTRLNRTYLDNSEYPDSYRKKVACHELGHVLGLWHDTTDTCMVEGYSTVDHPSGHDIDLINSLY